MGPNNGHKYYGKSSVRGQRESDLSTPSPNLPTALAPGPALLMRSRAHRVFMSASPRKKISSLQGARKGGRQVVAEDDDVEHDQSVPQMPQEPNTLFKEEESQMVKTQDSQSQAFMQAALDHLDWSVPEDIQKADSSALSNASAADTSANTSVNSNLDQSQPPANDDDEETESGNETDGLLFEQPDPLNQLVFNIQHLLTSVREIRRKDRLAMKAMRKEIKTLKAGRTADNNEKTRLLKAYNDLDSTCRRDQRKLEKLEKENNASKQAWAVEREETRSVLKELDVIDRSLITVHKHVVKLVSDTVQK
ncbi:hypothetical protein HYPSUDRAFT_53710 [Hypholoma sublateritium FD-334 SS-4]|uniref:Uncharacterized protein n=1 Tax=Hypholoma sublateritium (strain FD-334 SS-4) TaxID=945553 RepID=A0A0D2P1D5_HYPSF|nr:hypothetical protein HYPSUDRAFT_53710 [Hypholoma sublateritium FD-334 SS-4]